MRRTADFDYELPVDRIAKKAAEPRDAARLLVDRGLNHEPEDRLISDLPGLLDSGDVVVVNRTRVLPARLELTKPTGGAVEVLLLERRGANTWEALVRPGRRVPPGMRISDPTGRIEVTVGPEVGDGVRLVDVRNPRAGGDGAIDDPAEGDVIDLICAVGDVPLPPYLSDVVLDDPERYQTIFSVEQPPVSSAAPTAGLHMTRRLVERLGEAGIEVVEIDLAVGLGTFRPITTDMVADHPMHSEPYRVTPQAWATITGAPRVVAVGTTTVRTLETVARTGELEGHTDLFVHGDFDFEVVDRLLTNFHQPRSSLLVMIEAFIGGRWREIYDHAARGGYRFLSLGDAMLLTRSADGGD